MVAEVCQNKQPMFLLFRDRVRVVVKEWLLGRVQATFKHDKVYEYRDVLRMIIRFNCSTEIALK